MAKKELFKGNIIGYTNFVSQRFGIDIAELKAALLGQFPMLRDSTRCPNCGGNMQIAVFRPSIFHCALLFAMAKSIRQRQEKLEFTKANLVHVPSLSVSHAIKCSSTQASYLNLIKQPSEKKNSGEWLITNWGWKFLRGEAIPAEVKYFHGELIGRSEETVTMASAIRRHADKVREARIRNKKRVEDYTSEFDGYDPSEWVQYDGVMQGHIFTN